MAKALNLWTMSLGPNADHVTSCHIEALYILMEPHLQRIFELGSIFTLDNHTPLYILHFSLTKSL